MGKTAVEEIPNLKGFDVEVCWLHCLSVHLDRIHFDILIGG